MAARLADHVLASRGPRRSFALVDLETTGGNAAHHRIIEVGIVLCDEGRVVEEWSTLVNPGRRIPAGIEAFTGISNAMVEDAPAFPDVAGEVFARLDGRIFVAHNARFDHGFLRSEFRRLDRRLSVPVLCTVKLSRLLYPDQASHSLDALIERHGLECRARHRALGDARVLAGFLECVVAEQGIEAVEAAVDRLSARPSLPAQLPNDLVDELPDGPGVYRFYATGNALLYVGKSTNIRTRVLQHFAAEHRSGPEQKLARLVVRVEWTETPGEIGALLEESRQIKTLGPSHNRRLRAADTCWTIRLACEGEALAPQVEELDAGVIDGCHGLFRSRRDAERTLERTAREAGLCLKVLGFERVDGSCFAYQLGRCRGACIGREPRTLHDARLSLALGSLRLGAWPFGGPVGLREAGLAGEEVHVFDAWRHLGTARSDDEIASILDRPDDVPFDPDVYRIIRRALSSSRAKVIDLRDRVGRR
jgi:DNA polymerase-3 subunit epsilon